MVPGKKDRAVTQTDIARELNVSVVSVSNALSGRGGVGQELRQRILDTADEMGYQRSAREERKGGKPVHIGVLIAKRFLVYTPSFYGKIYQEIVKEAAERKAFTFLAVLDPQDEAQGKLPEMLLEDNVDGLLVLGDMRKDYSKKLKEKAGFPVVFVDHCMDMAGADFIISSGYTGTCELTRNLLKAGYRQIGFVGNITATSSIMDRFLGYRKAMMEQDREIRREWIVSDREDPWDYIRVKLPDRLPEAFVCNCDKTAWEVIRALAARGLEVPRDVAITGFDHFLMEDTGDLSLDTYEVDTQVMARASVKVLLQRLEYPEFRPRLRVVTGRIIEGNSYQR